MNSVARAVGQYGWWLNVVLFLLGYSAWYISPQRLWIPQALAVFLPLTGFLAVMCIGTFAVHRSWSLAGSALIICLLLGFRFAQLNPARQNAPDGIRAGVLSLNTGSRTEDITWESNFVPEVRLLKPDIAALQESNLSYPDSLRALLSTPPVQRLGNLSLSFGKVSDIPAGGTTLPILSVHAAGAMEVIELPDDPREGQSLLVRRIIYLHGAALAVYNVHIQSFRRSNQGNRSKLNPVYWFKLFQQLGEDYVLQSRQVVRINDLLKAETLPYIVCADLNATVHSWNYKVLMGMTRDAVSQSGKGWNATYPARFPVMRIDYIFGGPGIRFESAATGSRTPADHRPVWATFVF